MGFWGYLGADPKSTPTESTAGAQRWHQVTQAFALVALDFDVPWR